ncbi:hypothetical protein [Epiphyas postvittana nucleopolyhedrovirus]|uniref:EP23 n=1 Tax=Epiphyas postvittana nucleopolyhedrovirus TaxID=70600 RepID=Q91GC7_NPVEP|nr:hypothetical protein [Epiphyas postvittana nucleopolyhedrovirus]AAK85692.1 unknown [Epiphyas postvittana nucleopolyhedrovirus]
MNVYLYQPDGEQDNDVTFYLPHATNSVIVYLFKVGEALSPNKTRLVSGYENGRPISMHVAIGVARKDAYMVSCVRAPCLFRELFVHNKYTAPLGFMIVRIARGAIQVWHLLSVRKSAEAKRTRHITGLRVHNNTGPDQFYPKEIINLSGNVSAAFVNSLQRCRANNRDVNMIKLFCVDLPINDSAVQFDKKV